MAAIIREHYSETLDPNFFSPRHSACRLLGRKKRWIIETRRRELKNLRVRLLSRRGAVRAAVARRYRVTVFVAWIKNEDGMRGQVVARAWLSTREKRGHQSGHHLNVAKPEWFKTPHRKEANQRKNRSSFRRQLMRVILVKQTQKLPRARGEERYLQLFCHTLRKKLQRGELFRQELLFILLHKKCNSNRESYLCRFYRRIWDRWTWRLDFSLGRWSSVIPRNNSRRFRPEQLQGYRPRPRQGLLP